MESKNLRFLLVSFLFAFALQEIAIGIYDLLPNFGKDYSYAGISQFLLALVVVTLSWIGWSTDIKDEQLTTLNSEPPRDSRRVF